jgi:hypothetical protein
VHFKNIVHLVGSYLLLLRREYFTKGLCAAVVSDIDIQLIAVPLIVTVLKLLEVMACGRGPLWNIIPTVACVA